MKKILIYGDSNVWGDNFLTGERIPDDKQWVNILQTKLNNYKLLQEGLPGRVSGSFDEEKPYKNGKDSFMSTFRTNAPFDKLIIALGTNDLQIKYNRSSEEIIKDLLWYREKIENIYEDLDDRKKYFVNNKLPEIIYILPVNFDYIKEASNIFDINSENKRQEIIKYFNDNNIRNISINDIGLSDGIHMNYDGHQKMAELVSGVIKDE